METARRLGVRTATSLVVASMVGTGVFTTTGFLARDLGSAGAVLLTWLAGGAFALFGALAYGELVAALPHNGGEYQLLTRLYHPALGFVAGFTSFLVGFCAPIAASSLLFGAYLARAIPGVPETPAAVALLVGTTALHLGRLERVVRLHDAVTAGKVLVVAALGIAGLLAGDPGRLFAAGPARTADAVGSGAFAVGLVYVSYAYSGWNAAAYVAGEVVDPARNLPRALLVGTTSVVALYLALNAAYLSAGPLADLAGVPEVAHAAARGLFGDGAARAVSGVIAFGLVSTVSAFVMTGPRVYEAMGLDHRALGFLSRRNTVGAPAPALVLQGAVSLLLVAGATVEKLVAYVGFTLTLFAGLAVLGVFRLRALGLAPTDRRLRTWGHPVTSLAFVALCGWMLVHAVAGRPAVAGAGVGTLVAGLVLWRWLREG